MLTLDSSSAARRSRVRAIPIMATIDCAPADCPAAAIAVRLPTLGSMTASRDELIHLIAGLPEDQVEAVLADVRRLTTQPSSGEWPPRFFGVGESNDGRTDNARRVDEILADGFGAQRS